jgi:hypothetical protein
MRHFEKQGGFDRLQRTKNQYLAKEVGGVDFDVLG